MLPQYLPAMGPCGLWPPKGLSGWRMVGPALLPLMFEQTGSLSALNSWPGPKGSIWLNLVGQGWSDDLAESSEVVHFQIDGARRSIGKPSTMEEVCLDAAGSDGSVWVSRWWLNPNNDDPIGCGGLTDGYARWDGRKWTPVAPPGGTQQSYNLLAVTDDGAGWALLVDGRLGTGDENPFALGRYADGRWRQVGPEYVFRSDSTPTSAVEQGHGGAVVPDQPPTGLTAVPGGRLCTGIYGRYLVQFDTSTDGGLPFTSVRCFDATGQVSHINTLDVGIVTDLSVAADGSMWVKMAPNGEIARLNGTSHAAAANPANINRLNLAPGRIPTARGRSRTSGVSGRTGWL